MEVGRRSEGQLLADGASGGLLSSSDGGLVGPNNLGKRRGSPTRSDVISRTTLPGYRSGMAVTNSRIRDGDADLTVWMIVKGARG